MSLFLTIMLAANLVCPKTKVINYSKHKWNKFDQQTLDKSKKRCEELYEKSPCVKIFYKVKKMDYKVVCGAQENNLLTK